MKPAQNTITRRIGKQIGAITRLLYRDIGKPWLAERHQRRLDGLYAARAREFERVKTTNQVKK
jgi:hypothetical protein